jgi:hypothetical protein
VEELFVLGQLADEADDEVAARMERFWWDWVKMPAPADAGASVLE